MKKYKAFLAAIISSAAVFAAASCSGENESSSNPYADVDVSPEVRNRISQRVTETDFLPDTELENKTIKWLSDWDINPNSSGKNKPVDLVAFEEKYGGKIEFIQCDYGNRYEKLAEMINSGDGVDFFYGGNMDAFPKGAVRGMFVPADDYIDFGSPLWEGVRSVNESLLWNNRHYCVVVQTTGDKVACVYNRKTIREVGLDDPAELFAKDEWNWNTFENMIQRFADTDNQRYGIDGWWYEFALISTTGVPAVSIDNGKLVSNISSPAMERVQNYIYDLYSTGCIAIGVGDYGWTDHPEYIGEGKLLFYPVGLYSLYCESEQWKSIYGEDVFFVPMPKDPEADKYYIPVGMESYCLVKGGSNPEGVARFLDCKRFAIIDDEIDTVGTEQLFDDFGWTDEMFEMYHKMRDMASENPFLDISTGVSADCAELLDNSLRLSGKGTPWNETYDSVSPVLDKYLDEINGVS
ncbi:MAG: ABC transporter substrate-binding protein [Ruminococcus sp.]|nr:ABC transporter substrate-binding protein [Ruminococcus sp.]